MRWFLKVGKPVKHVTPVNLVGLCTVNFSPVEVLSEHMLKPSRYEIEHELLLFCLNLYCREMLHHGFDVWVGLVFWASKLDRVYLLERCYPCCSQWAGHSLSPGTNNMVSHAHTFLVFPHSLITRDPRINRGKTGMYYFHYGGWWGESIRLIDY